MRALRDFGHGSPKTSRNLEKTHLGAPRARKLERTGLEEPRESWFGATDQKDIEKNVLRGPRKRWDRGCWAKILEETMPENGEEAGQEPLGEEARRTGLEETRPRMSCAGSL